MLYFLFFLSGFSALIYEITWLRKLELIFGTTTYAVSTVLAVFFTGLAIGSFGLGKLRNFKFSGEARSRIARQISKLNSLVLYGLLEISIGIYALLTPWIFQGIEALQIGFWQMLMPSYSGFSLFTFLLSFLGLLLPTILMGGTFPVITKAMHVADRGGEESGVAGKLYAINTLGAVLGTFLAGFFLIANLGVNETIWLAGGVSVLIGVVALLIVRKFRIEN